MILGNYTDDTNLLGTLGQMLVGLIGLDLPADIRDLVYDVTNFEMSPKHLLQTLLDFVSLLPVVGGIKYIDEAGNVLKPAAKHADEAAEAVNTATKTDITEKATKHGIERLRQRGFSKSDILNTKMTSNIKTQGDGAKVYIKEIDNGKFDIIVEGEIGIITALKNIDKKSLERLTKNYNWR